MARTEIPRASVVYLYTFSDGMVYIGKTSQKPASRASAHLRLSKKEEYRKFPFYERLHVEPFTKLVVDSTWSDEQQALDEELRLIQKFTAEGRCLNYRKSTWGNKAWTDSDETRAKKRTGRLGKHHTEETKQFLSEYQTANPSKGNLGNKYSLATREQIANNVANYAASQGPDYRKGEFNPNWRGDNVSARTKRRRAQYAANPALYEARKQKRREARRKKREIEFEHKRILAANAIPSPFDSWIG